MSNKIHLVRVKKLTSFIKKTVGLIGKEETTSVLLETRYGIHTFGVLFPIDVLILNKDHRVTKKKQNLRPNSFFFWNPIYNTVLELPINTIKNNSIQIGDR